MKRTTKTALLIIAIGAGILFLSFSFSLWHTKKSFSAAKSLDIPTAAHHANQALWVPQSLSAITFENIPEIVLWRDGLKIITILHSISLISENTEPKTTKNTYHQQILSLQSSVFEQLPKSFIAKKIIFSRYDEFFPKDIDLSTLFSDSNIISNSLLSGSHTYIIALQNSNELRASGGFMGSYAKVSLEDGQIIDLAIHDIYEPDGQFTGYIEAPTGVKEYLSSGNGMRLPDSNWHPDFPTSAQTSLSYFALGKDTAVDGLIALNLGVMEQILEVTGNIYLPDYDITVSSENLADVARVNRDEFFPGSQQKKHFLSALLKKVQFKFENLSAKQQKEIALIIVESLENKDIQMYSHSPELQSLFEKYRVAGELTYAQPNTTLLEPATKNYQSPSKDQNLSAYLYLVESNVGINKANKHIERSVQVKNTTENTHIALSFMNKNQPPQDSLAKETKQIIPKTRNELAEADHLGYVNYQRVLLHPGVEIASITINNTNIPQWDEEIITNSHGDRFKQAGFLITVPEQENAVMVMTLNTPYGISDHLTIQKQPGLPKTPYTIQNHGISTELFLQKDTSVNLVY